MNTKELNKQELQASIKAMEDKVVGLSNEIFAMKSQLDTMPDELDLDYGKPENGDRYAHTGSDGSFSFDTWTSVKIDKERWHFGNIYTGANSVARAADLQRLTTKYLRVIAAENRRIGFVVDWSNLLQNKYFHNFDHRDSRVTTMPTAFIQKSRGGYNFDIESDEPIRSHFTAVELRWIITGVKP